MASNPQLMQLLAALQARNAMGGMAPGGAAASVAGGPPPAGAPAAPPGAPGPGDGAPDAGGDFSSMLSDLRRADPGITMRQLRFIKQIFAAMLVHNLEPNPSISGKIAKVIPHIDAIMKEAERASTVSGAVRAPIQMGAASPAALGAGPPGAGPGSMGAAGPMGP